MDCIAASQGLLGGDCSLFADCLRGNFRRCFRYDANAFDVVSVDIGRYCSKWRATVSGRGFYASAARQSLLFRTRFLSSPLLLFPFSPQDRLCRRVERGRKASSASACRACHLFTERARRTLNRFCRFQNEQD